MGKNKVSIINLDKLLAEMVHRPRIDGFPLYARVDNQLESGDGLIIENRGGKWDRASKISYNSPGNIRRIFITYKGVYIHYYTPVVGDKRKSLVQGTKFPIPLNEVLTNMYGSGMVTEPRYRVRGQALSILYKPWVCSNIEEVYFDWSILLSEDIANMGMGNLFLAYTNIKSDKMVDYQPIKNIFEITCLRNISNMRERFPRLRCIGYISLLDEIYEAVEQIRDKSSLKVWCNNEIIIDAIKNPDIVVSIYKFDDVKDGNTKFSIKDGLYLYDRGVLKEYQRRFKEKVKNQIKNDIEDDKNKSSIEIKLGQIKEKYGLSMAKIAFNVAVSGIDQDEVRNVINNMSTDGKNNYANWIGVN